MKEDPGTYKSNNKWKQKVYRHMSHYLENKGVSTFGKSSGGNCYKHLLKEEDSVLNFINYEIYNSTLKRFANHKAGDLHRILTNTASSQTYCFNLFIHLNNNKGLANQLFSHLLNKQIEIVHIEPEFTPNTKKYIPQFELGIGDESIGDQGQYSGTDADVAIFYQYESSKTGILLIEFKFIEHEFSVCTSYKYKNDIQSICNSSYYYKYLVEEKATNYNKGYLCGYNKYCNWGLTESSEIFDINKIKSLNKCPFMFGLNQLWRNMLLAERVSEIRNCDEYSFWVFSVKENDSYLWGGNGNGIEKLFRNILTEKGNSCFRKIYLEEVYDKLKVIAKDEADVDWLFKMKEKYFI